METLRHIREFPLIAAVFLFSGHASFAEHGPGGGYAVNPYSGMFGSMGNVYSPYYRQFHTPGMSGMSGMAPGSGRYGQ